ncbi:T9SS type A sorting domain-containing protein [Flavobacterium zepuense]|uniref:T9SS type A sorting domain-containing protein n=1 Tax=Flavobacterium zepuense TaxID=2593302 RepID=A0A552UX33_9FLAO|nr:M12 family metallo-peptidase [Flavobacterium zepuense]TRW22769.1 T9SS type A sorting domain-containing protein [Flavobacterium zepuense]
MKKLALLVTLLSTTVFYAQHKVAEKVSELIAQNTKFTAFAPLQQSANLGSSATNKIVTNATYAVIDKAALANILASKPQTIELSIPYNNTVVTMQLYRSYVLAKDFHAETNRGIAISYDPGVYYRGIIKGDSSSLASFNFFNGEMNGVVSSSALNNLVVGKLKRKKNTTDYIIYSDSKLNLLNDFNCLASEASVSDRAFQKSGLDINDTQSSKCTKIYFEIDNVLFQANDLSTTNTGNWLTSIFNNIQTLYANDGIDVALKSFMVWTEFDPYFGDTSNDYLDQFFDEYQFSNFDGDIGQLLGIDGGLGGLAYVGGVCSGPYNVSYVDIDYEFEEVPVFSWTIEAMTHEIGHQLGSPHTHACAWNGNNTAIDGCGTQAGAGEGDCAMGPIPSFSGGTIMSYCHLLNNVGINFANGFGPQPAARILAFVNSSSCLDLECISVCENSISQLLVNNVNASGATVSWDGLGNDWETSVATYSAGLSNWNDTSSSSINLNNLEPNTYYVVGVKQVCEDGTSETVQTVFATDADWCAGQVFTDVGGPTGMYDNSQHIERTFTPDDANLKIIADFTSFKLETNFDYLYVYNGADTNAPLIASLTGGSIPPAIQSTAADGSLTFVFESDEEITSPGWISNVSCVSGTASLQDNTFANFAYYPNPAKNSVTITSGEEFQEIMVYNVAGQLLLHKKVNTSTATADISSFSNGVYFFKVVGNSKEANFRIIKQ